MQTLLRVIEREPEAVRRALARDELDSALAIVYIPR